MAIIRQSPKCIKCDGIINAIYLDQSNIPELQRIIGDTFLKWDYEGHKCEYTLPHQIALVIWNEFIAKTSNQGIDFSFENLENRINEIINTVIENDIHSHL
jgi:hypothetical protein